MKLSVKYAGYEADRGRMNALDLGPAIIGVGEMVGEASRVLYNDATRVKVEVRADFEHASFGLEFLAIAAAGIGSLSLQQLANVATVLGFGVGATVGGVKGVIGLLRWQRRRAIDRVERQGDQITITINDQSINVTQNVYNVFIDPHVRKGFERLVEPMEKEGVESVSLQAEDNPPEVIRREERSVFSDAPLPEEPVAIDRSTATLEIISISFREGNKWRFAQGGSAFHADILDDEFLGQVRAQRERFGAGDALRVEMEIETRRVADGELRFERRITHVIEHIRAVPDGGQIGMDLA